MPNRTKKCQPSNCEQLTVESRQKQEVDLRVVGSANGFFYRQRAHRRNIPALDLQELIPDKHTLAFVGW
jgi:hypothetical protein